MEKPAVSLDDFISALISVAGADEIRQAVNRLDQPPLKTVSSVGLNDKGAHFDLTNQGIKLFGDNGVLLFAVDLNGTLRATRKSFAIPHPIKEGKELVHGCVEANEHAVTQRVDAERIGPNTYRGTLPEYWAGLVAEYSIFGNGTFNILSQTGAEFTVAFTGEESNNTRHTFLVWGSRKDSPLVVEPE